MISQFIYLGRSSADFGLLIEAPPSRSIAKRDLQRVVIPGRSGTLEIDNNRFDDVELRYQIGFKVPRGEVPYIGRQMAAWLLSSTGFHQLSDTYDTYYYNKASFSGPIDISNVFMRGGKASLIFSCDPYRYSFVGQQKFVYDTHGSIVNPESFSSKPYIKVQGNGYGELYIGNTTITISNIDEYLELDSEIEQAFKAGQNKNSTVTLAEFPAFGHGLTSIQWAGGITSLEITPRWRTL